MSGGKVTLNAPTGIDYKTPANMNVQSRNMDLSDHNRIHGCLESETGTFVDKNGVALGTHTHNKGAKPDPRSKDGICVNDSYGLEEDFETTLEELDPTELTERDRLLLCLPEIAEHEAARAHNHDDARGWMYLRSMLHKWFSGPGNANADASPSAFWVDWDWMMRYEQACDAYEALIKSKIFNIKARNQLGKILKNMVA